MPRRSTLRDLFALKPDGAARHVRGIEVGAEPGGGRAVGQRADYELARFALAALGCRQRVQVDQERAKIGLHGCPVLLHAVERRCTAEIETELVRACRRRRPSGRLRSHGAFGRQRNRCGDDGVGFGFGRRRRRCRAGHRRGNVRLRLRCGAAARAARTAAVAAACRLMAPVMSSTLLWSGAMCPASRSRSALKARTCAVNIWVSNSMGDARRHLCNGTRLAGGENRAQTVGCGLGLTRYGKRAQRGRRQAPRPRLRGSRKLISAGAGRHGVLDGRVIENINRIRQIPLFRLSRCPGIGLLPVSRLGYGMRHVGSENQNPDASSIMPCHCARRRRGHANAFAQAQGHA